MAWDVMGGVARRNWARNPHSIEVSLEYNEKNKGTDHITIPYVADEGMLQKLIDNRIK